jgi:hypothetical protein
MLQDAVLQRLIVFDLLVAVLVYAYLQVIG